VVDLAIFSPMGVVSNNPNFLVSSIQMYINVTSPVIEFFADANPTPIHTISNTGRYTGTRLQTFDIPHVNMATVTSVRIRSTSAIDSNITWYGLQRTNNNNGSSGYVFTGNFTSDSVPLTIFDNATVLNSSNEFSPSLATPSSMNFNIQPNREYNFNPFYLIIPNLTFAGPSSTINFVLELTENNIVVTTVNFSLATNLPYSSGIVIPLTNDSTLVPANMVHTVTPSSSVTTTRTNPAYLRGTQSIGGRLSWTNAVTNLSMQTRINDNSGLGVRIFGTGVTLHPLFTPNSKDIRSPITFSPNKMITFPNILTATDRIAASNTMSYAIIQPTPNIVTPQTTSNQENGGTQSFSLLSAFNDNNATIAVIAQSSGARGLHARSIFSQPSIFNYQNLLPGRVVPFVNTNVNSTNLSDQTFTSGNATSFIAMNVTFTRNVVLNSLDFGYVFPIFLDASNVAIGGYGSDSPSATSTFTITLTSIPRIDGEPSITYGRVQFVCRPNQTNAYRAMHTSTDNQTGANDGTLLSIPFTTTALTTLPTFVNSFTPSVAGSNFTFNVGDQVRIEFAFSQSNSRAIMTLSDATRFLHIVVHQEMVGALVCTPNPPTDNPQPLPPPSNIWFSTNTGEITTPTLTHTLQTETYTFDAPTILHGFRLTAFTLQGVTAIMRIRVHVFRTRNNNTSNIFQVYFDYNNWISGSAPLFIPFSYAEFNRYATDTTITTNANDVARINPRSIVFSRPQHPIFNQNDAIRMEISITTIPSGGISSALSQQTIVYRGNATNNTIAGRLSGIRLNTPTITTLSPITPVYSFHTNTRSIAIPAPTSNSTGAFMYTLTSQEIDPSNGVATPTPGTEVTINANNQLITSPFFRFQSRVTIQAFQRSSTMYSNGSATFPIIDLINSGHGITSLSTPNPVGGLASYGSNLRFAAWIPFNASLLGFSFQFFGGYGSPRTTTYTNVTVIVEIFRGGLTLPNTLTIQFTQNPTNSDVLDGTMLYIPFGQNTIQTPTFVSNLTYTGSLVPVQVGDFVTVRANNVNVGTRAISSLGGFGSGSNFGNTWTMAGSLLFANVTSGINPASSTTVFTTPSVAVDANTNTFLFQVNNINQVPDFTTRNMLLINFRIPNIFLNDSLPAPTNVNPYIINFVVSVRDAASSNQTVYENRITIGIVSSNATFVELPFDMPLPGNTLSREDVSGGGNGRGYYIESLEPSFSPDYFVQHSTDFNTFSYPRIPSRSSFVYTVRVQNLARPFIIQNVNNPLGSNILSSLNFVQL